jgi:hypothetical protein
MSSPLKRSSISWTGKRSLPGIPPAKEMMCGLEARVMRSLISEERSDETALENLGIVVAV